MERRKFMKAAGGTVGAASLGGAGLLATSGASASGGFDFSETVTITSDDGSVEYVAIYGDSIVSWEGFETPAAYFGIDIDLTVYDGNGDPVVENHDLHQTGPRELLEDWGGANESSSGPGTSGTIESAIGLDENGDYDGSVDWHLVQDPDADSAGEYGLPQTPVDASKLEVGGDGETTTFELVMDSTYTWYEADDTSTEIHSKTFTTKLDVKVENIPTSASTSDGDGEDGATGA